jgi:acetyltransferase-like isoleucine patch superfamily enzyme
VVYNIKMSSNKFHRLLKNCLFDIFHPFSKLPLSSNIDGHITIERLSKHPVISIGKHFAARENCYIGCNGKLEIGDNVFLNRNVSITSMEEIVIGNNVTIGNNVVIVDHDHCKDSPGFSTKKIIIGDNVWIGANSIILKGSTIGNGSTIGAGTIVKTNVAENVVFINKKTEVSVPKAK